MSKKYIKRATSHKQSKGLTQKGQEGEEVEESERNVSEATILQDVVEVESPEAQHARCAEGKHAKGEDLRGLLIILLLSLRHIIH